VVRVKIASLTTGPRTIWPSRDRFDKSVRLVMYWLRSSTRIHDSVYCWSGASLSGRSKKYLLSRNLPCFVRVSSFIHVPQLCLSPSPYSYQISWKTDFLDRISPKFVKQSVMKPGPVYSWTQSAYTIVHWQQTLNSPHHDRTKSLQVIRVQQVSNDTDPLMCPVSTWLWLSVLRLLRDPSTV
jgi:hypothetical protein